MSTVSVEHQVTTTFKLVDEETLVFMGLIEKCLRVAHSLDEQFGLTADEFKLYGRLQRDLEAVQDVIHRFKD